MGQPPKDNTSTGKQRNKGGDSFGEFSLEGRYFGDVRTVAMCKKFGSAAIAAHLRILSELNHRKSHELSKHEAMMIAESYDVAPPEAFLDFLCLPHVGFLNCSGETYTSEGVDRRATKRSEGREKWRNYKRGEASTPVPHGSGVENGRIEEVPHAFPMERPTPTPTPTDLDLKKETVRPALQKILSPEPVVAALPNLDGLAEKLEGIQEPEKSGLLEAIPFWVKRKAKTRKPFDEITFEFFLMEARRTPADTLRSLRQSLTNTHETLYPVAEPLPKGAPRARAPDPPRPKLAEWKPPKPEKQLSPEELAEVREKIRTLTEGKCKVL